MRASRRTMLASMLSLVVWLATLPYACARGAAAQLYQLVSYPCARLAEVRRRAGRMALAAELLDKERAYARELADELASVKAKLSEKRRELSSVRAESDQANTRARRAEAEAEGAANGRAARAGAGAVAGAGAGATGSAAGRGALTGKERDSDTHAQASVSTLWVYVLVGVAIFASVSFSRGGVLTQLESKLITSVAIPMVLTLGFAEGAKARVTAMCMASFCQGVLATAYLRADDPQPAVPW